MASNGSKLQALISKVQGELNDSTGEMWPSLQIGIWINDAKDYICQKGNFRFMQKKATLVFSEGAESVDMPSNVKKIINATLGGGSFSYDVFGDSIEFAGAQSSAGSVSLEYYAYIPDITDTSNEFPKQFESILVDYAVSRAKIKEEISLDIAESLLSAIVDPKISLMQQEEGKFSTPLSFTGLKI